MYTSTGIEMGKSLEMQRRRWKREVRLCVCVCVCRRNHAHHALTCCWHATNGNSSDTFWSKSFTLQNRSFRAHTHTFPTINQWKEKRRIENSFVFLERVNMCVGFRLFFSLVLLLKDLLVFPLFSTNFFFSRFTTKFTHFLLYFIFVELVSIYAFFGLYYDRILLLLPFSPIFPSAHFSSLLFCFCCRKNVTFRHLHVFHFAWTNC